MVAILAVAFLVIIGVIDVIRVIQICRDFKRRRRDDYPSLNNA
jgi:hypothetical protein